MKKNLAVQFIYLICFLVLTILYKNWIDLIYLPFVIGGFIGVLMPYLDYLIYAYLLNPEDQNSKTAVGMISKKNFSQSIGIFIGNREVQKELLFHKAYFQIIFLVFLFLIVTSSGSLLGRGIVCGFALHLIMDQVMDLMEKKEIDVWFEGFPFEMDSLQKKVFIIANAGIFLLISFLR